MLFITTQMVPVLALDQTKVVCSELVRTVAPSQWFVSEKQRAAGKKVTENSADLSDRQKSFRELQIGMKRWRPQNSVCDHVIPDVEVARYLQTVSGNSLEVLLVPHRHGDIGHFALRLGNDVIHFTTRTNTNRFRDTQGIAVRESFQDFLARYPNQLILGSPIAVEPGRLRQLGQIFLQHVEKDPTYTYDFLTNNCTTNIAYFLKTNGFLQKVSFDPFRQFLYFRKENAPFSPGIIFYHPHSPEFEGFTLQGFFHENLRHPLGIPFRLFPLVFDPVMDKYRLMREKAGPVAYVHLAFGAGALMGLSYYYGQGLGLAIHEFTHNLWLFYLELRGMPL